MLSVWHTVYPSHLCLQFWGILAGSCACWNLHISFVTSAIVLTLGKSLKPSGQFTCLQNGDSDTHFRKMLRETIIQCERNLTTISWKCNTWWLIRLSYSSNFSRFQIFLSSLSFQSPCDFNITWWWPFCLSSQNPVLDLYTPTFLPVADIHFFKCFSFSWVYFTIDFLKLSTTFPLKSCYLNNCASNSWQH